MAQILFVTGSAGGGEVGTLQHRGTLRKSNGDTCNALSSSLMRAATMPLLSDKLHNVLLANRPDAIPDKNNITVQGILEKSQSAAAAEAESSRARLQASLTDAMVAALDEFLRNSNAAQPMR